MARRELVLLRDKLRTSSPAAGCILRALVIKSSSEPAPDLIRGPNSLAEQEMVRPSQLGFLVAAEGCAVLSASGGEFTPILKDGIKRIVLGLKE